MQPTLGSPTDSAAQQAARAIGPTEGLMQLPISLAFTDIDAHLEERDLVEQAKRDRDAFAALYRKHYASIAGFIYRRVADPHLTEDLVAEVFFAALRGLGRYRDRGLPVRAWLYRIAVNTVNRWARRERRVILRRFSELSDGDHSALDARRNVSVDQRDNEFMRLAVLSLKQKYQSVLSLHYLEGMSLEEIAVALGCRIGTVKSRLSRGRDALRDKLSRRGDRNVARTGD